MADDLLICGRFHGWEDDRVTGSAVRQCINCGHEVWVSPDGLAREDLPKLCLECAIEISEGDEEIVPLPGRAERYTEAVPLVQRLIRDKIRERKGDT